MNRIILLGGGVGPLAGLELHRLILKNTKACKDQEHLRIIHLSCPDLIEDRTEALLAGEPEKPAQGMADILLAGADAALRLAVPCVAGIPCNTFHAAPIWGQFAQYLTAAGFIHPVLNMIEETISHIQSRYKHTKNIGILSTTGTRKFGIYSTPLRQYGLNVIEARDQEKTHSLIYNPDWGIKSNANISQKARTALQEQIVELEKQGAELIILGCTELPLAVAGETHFPVPLLDPMNILAASLVSMATSNEPTVCC